jgi:protein RecA
MSAADELAALLAKEVGVSDEKQTVTNWIDTGFPNLNDIMSGKTDGGLAFGRLYEFYSPSSAGKTALAVQIMIEAQRMGGIAIFEDYERTFEVVVAESNGLSTRSPFWHYKRPKTWEEGNDHAIKMVSTIRRSKLLPRNAPIIVVQDSIAAAIPQSMLDKTLAELNMNDNTALSRVMSTTLKKINSAAEEYDATFVYLNQIRTKPGVLHGDPTTTPGGNAMEFYASGRLSLARTRIMSEGKEKEMIGQLIKAKCVKSKHTRPFRNADLYMTFDNYNMAVFDHIETLVEYLAKLGAIEQSGNRVQWDGKLYYKSQIIEALKKARNGKAKLMGILEAWVEEQKRKREEEERRSKEEEEKTRLEEEEREKKPPAKKEKAT